MSCRCHDQVHCHPDDIASVWRYGSNVMSHSRWAVAVRLADGSRRLLCAPESRTGGQDQWSPRLTQARSFSSQAEAEKSAAAFMTNDTAKEYLAIRL
jgi:hypothetical protein